MLQTIPCLFTRFSPPCAGHKILETGSNRMAQLSWLTMHKLLATTLLPVLLAAGLNSCEQPDPELQLEGATMGTTYAVQSIGCDSGECEHIEELVDARLKEISSHLSHYDPASELSAFNDYRGTDWYPVSAELGAVVEYALKVSEQSGGAFDISVATAVDAWGFGPTDGLQAEPAAATLATALSHSGYTKLASRASPRAIRKDDPLIRLDLSALAKGYAVDQLAYLLEDHGIQNYLVEIGGEVRTAGVRSDGKPWRIGIQPPADGLDLEFVVQPGDSAVATSGDYRNFYMLGDRRISHAIDPGTAQPVDNRVMSVSVIAPDAMQADALATALMVMGSEAGSEFARTRGIAALIIERTEHGSKAISTPEFDHYRATDQ